MKISTFLLLFFVLAANAAYAQPNQTTVARVKETPVPAEWKESPVPSEWKESPVPSEWKVPAGVGMLKQDLAMVKEANAANYTTLVAFKAGKIDGDTNEVPQGVKATDCKIIVLFKNDAAWAAPLRANELRVSDAKVEAVLTKYQLNLDKFYGAENNLDGLVIKFASDNVNMAEAARELSEVAGVEMVHVKAPR